MESVNYYEKLIALLESKKINDDVGYCSHVSMYNPVSSRYCLSNRNIDELFDNYCAYLAQGNEGKMGIAEYPKSYAPFMIDIDIKIPYSSLTVEQSEILARGDVLHLYERKHVLQVVDIAQNILMDVVDKLHTYQLNVCVLEKGAYVVMGDETKPDVVKSGFHLHFHEIFLRNYEIQQFIDPKMKELLDDYEVFSDLGFEKSADVYDSTIGKTWMMYGCRKKEKNSKPYLVTDVINHKGESISLEDAFKYYAVFDCEDNAINIRGLESFYLPRILSIIQQNRPHMNIKSELLAQNIIVLENERSRKLPSNYKTEVAENLRLLDLLLPLIKTYRSERFDDWFNIGMMIYSVSEGTMEGFERWLTFSRRTNVGNFDEDECYARWSKMKTGSFTIGTLRWYAKQDSPEEYEKLTKTITCDLFANATEHYEIANILYNEYADEFVCADVANNVWYRFYENYWHELDDAVELRRLIVNNLAAKFKERANMHFKKGLEQEDDGNENKKANRMHKIVKKLNNKAFVNGVVHAAADLFFNPKFKTKINRNPMLFPFKNCVYDFNKNLPRKGDPSDFISNFSDIDYEEFTDDHPKVREVKGIFERIFVKERLRNYFYYVCSTFFIGGNKEKFVYFFTGVGNNGKSITVLFLEKVFCKLAIKFNTTMVTGKKVSNGQADPELSRSDNGCRIAFLEEPDPGEKLNIGRVKKYSGNDTLICRDLFQKGKNMLEFQPLFKMVFVSNGVLEAQHPDVAFFNRVRVIPFESTFVGTNEECPETYEEQCAQKIFPMDKELMWRLEHLAPAFAWFLLQFRNRHLSKSDYEEPDEVLEATSKYKSMCDLFRQYQSERIELNVNNWEIVDDVFDDFKLWIKRVNPSGACPNRQTCITNMERMFGGLKDNMWFGIRIRDLGDLTLKKEELNRKCRAEEAKAAEEAEDAAADGVGMVEVDKYELR